MSLATKGDGFEIETDALFEKLIAGGDKAELSRGFHAALSNAIVCGAEKIRKQTGENKVCLSGGVFQNRLLLSLAKAGLKNGGFQVYYNKKHPIGDGGLALGQLYFKEKR